MPKDPESLEVASIEEASAAPENGVCFGYAPMPEAEELDRKWAEEGRAHLSPASYDYLLDRFPGTRTASEELEEIILPLPAPPERNSGAEEAVVADMLDVAALESAQDIENRRRIVLPVREVDALMAAEIARALEEEGRVAAATEVSAQAAISEPEPWYWLPSPNTTVATYTKYFYSVHSTEGGFAGASSWLRDSRSSASCHPVIPRAGDRSHVLAGDFWASWTEAVWYYNMHSCSIEMEGYAAKNFWPEAEYDLCAAWGAYYCDVANIPARLGCTYARHSAYRAGIITHNSVPLPSTHTDPGPYFDLEKLERMVKQKLGLVSAPTPKPTPKPEKPSQIEFVNYVPATGDGWGYKIARAMDAGLTAVGVSGATSEKAAKAAGNAREETGVYTFLIGQDAIDRAKRFQDQFTDKEISYDLSGKVRVVTPAFRDRAKWRMSDFCREFGLDKAKAIAGFEDGMREGGKEEEPKVPETKPGSTYKDHEWQGWHGPKPAKNSGSYIDRAPTRWHTHWYEQVADLAKQIEQKWPGVSCLTYIPGHPLVDWAIANKQHEVSLDVWWKYRGNPLPWEIHNEIWRWLMNDQPLPIRYLITGGDNLNREWDWMWVRGKGWEKYYSPYYHGNHPHVTFAIGPRANG